MKTKQNKDRCADFAILFFIFFIWVLFPIQSRAGGILTGIKIDPEAMNASKEEVTRISWSQSTAGKVEVYVCALDGRIVKTLLDQEDQPAGQQQVQWNGRDEFNNICPTGAYIPIIRISTKTRGYDIYNPTALEWGRQMMPENIVFKNRKIAFHLNQAALCLLRIGERDGGPLYKTSLYWEPKSAGDHEIEWDGRDADGLFLVMQREKAFIDFDAFTLPENSILLEGLATQSPASDSNYKTYPIHPPAGKDASVYAIYFQNNVKGITFSDQWIDTSVTNTKEVRVHKDQTLRITLSNDVDTQEMLKRGLELYIYVDGEFFYEMSLTKTPFDMKLDTSKLKNGKHIVTLNVRVKTGQVGVHSMKIMVKN